MYCSAMASTSKSKGSKPWKRGKHQVLVSDDKAQEQQTDKHCHKWCKAEHVPNTRQIRTCWVTHTSLTRIRMENVLKESAKRVHFRSY